MTFSERTTLCCIGNTKLSVEAAGWIGSSGLTIELALELKARIRNVWGLEDRGHDTNPARAGLQNAAEIAQVDSANCEPGQRQIVGRPPDKLQRHRFRGWFGPGSEHRADGYIVRSGRDGTVRLAGGVAAKAKSQRIPKRWPGGAMHMARLKEIFLAQMANLGADRLGEFRKVIDYKPNSGAACDGEDSLRDPAHLRLGQVLGTKLNQIAPSLAKPFRNRLRRPIREISQIDEGIEKALV